MEKDRSILRYLLLITGKTLYITGLVLIILMILFGLWPSLSYILLMLAGAWLVYLGRNWRFNTETFRWAWNGFKNVPGFNLPKPDLNRINEILKTALLVFFGLLLIIIMGFWVASDLVKKKYTVNDSKQIVLALNDYYKYKSRYPDNLSTIINKDPLRQSWRNDHWNNPYYYASLNNGQGFKLISPGKDGRLNTTDDIQFSNYRQ
jgi:hypothetical protein